MKALSFLAVILALGLSFGATDAEAKRMGGGKSFGMQRQSTAPAKAPAPGSTPAKVKAALHAVERPA